YEYADNRGGTVRVRLVGTLPVRSGILQGALIIDEKHFAAAFPDSGGYRMWPCGYAPYLLREAALKSDGGISGQSDHEVMKLRNPEPGVRVETVEERLRLLGSVESAYLDMFLVLGGLGVVLGVAGVALVILRGVEERRGEMALLSAVGVSKRTVVRLLAGEYGILVAGGLVSGILPALVSIQPAVRALHADFPWRAMTAVIAGMLLCAALSVWGAALVASRRFGPATLKEEV
ncbi:MAG: ABC transporter permease, partial [Kiritimatiellae bacterium]|nr:ABC transporter permease [Kiritimatiellia bacterium]